MNVRSFATVHGKQFMSLFDVKLKHMHDQNLPRRCMDWYEVMYEVVIFIEYRLQRERSPQNCDNIYIYM